MTATAERRQRDSEETGSGLAGSRYAPRLVDLKRPGERMRLRSQVPVLGVTLILVGCVGPSAIEESEGAEKVIDQILDLSGTTETIDNLPGLIDQQVATQLGAIEGEDAVRFRDVMGAAFDPQWFRSAIAASLLENYDESHAKSTLDWYRSDLGAKIRENEVEAQSLEAQQDLLEFSQSFEKTPPSPARVEFVRRLDAATRSTELSLKMMVALMRGMLAGFAALGTGEAPTPAQIDAILEKQMGQLAPMIQAETLVTLLFSTRTLTDAETSAYLRYAESDAGRWLHTQMGAGLINVMLRAGNAFSTHLTVVMEDMKGSISPEEAGQLRESTISDGRAFGKTTKQGGCIDEAFERNGVCRDFTCIVLTGDFLEGCLETSQKEASICAGAPSDEDLAATIYWRLARCEERGTTTTACNRLMGMVQEYCASPRIGV